MCSNLDVKNVTVEAKVEEVIQMSKPGRDRLCPDSATVLVFQSSNFNLKRLFGDSRRDAHPFYFTQRLILALQMT